MDEGLTGESIGETPKERMLTETQVADIVKKEKHRAAESARREYEGRLQEQPMQGANGNMQQAGFDKDSLKKELLEDIIEEGNRMREEAEREQMLRHLQDTADQYHHKIKKGSELFENFDEVMADFDPAAFPTLIRLAAPMDNLSEIMYELTNNPSKLVEINNLAQTAPKLAEKQLKRLSESIGKNIEAKANTVNAPAPLSKIKPSSVGADTGKMTLRDLKKQNFLRG